MPVVGAAAITAAGVVTGGVLSSRASNKATQAQQQSTSAALAYQRERDQAQRASSDAAYADYRKEYNAWLNRFFPGYSVSGPSLGGAAGPSKSSQPMTAPGTAQQSFGAAPMMAGPSPVPGTSAQPKTLADLSQWNDWKQYGVGA